MKDDWPIVYKHLLWQFPDHSILIQTIILLAHCYYRNEAGDFITTQGLCADM